MTPLATAPLEQASESSTIVFLRCARRCVENAFGILAIGAKRISAESVCRKD